MKANDLKVLANGGGKYFGITKNALIHARTTFGFKTENDLQYAVVEYGIQIEAATVIPYGVELDALPAKSDLHEAKLALQKQYHIQQNEKIILFNGTLNYQPNLDALVAILDGINPFLLATDLKYKILICGKNLPAAMNDLQDYYSRKYYLLWFLYKI